MAKPNYNFAKRQRDLAKEQKKEERLPARKRLLKAVLLIPSWTTKSTAKVKTPQKIPAHQKTKLQLLDPLGPVIHNPAHRICDQDQQPGC